MHGSGFSKVLTDLKSSIAPTELLEWPLQHHNSISPQGHTGNTIVLKAQRCPRAAQPNCHPAPTDDQVFPGGWG